MFEARACGQCNHSCPWRFENHGKLAKYAWDHEAEDVPTRPVVHYTRDRFWRWWQHLRTGKYGGGIGMDLCHVALKGTMFSGARRRLVTRQCTGGLVIQQRELLRHVTRGESTLTLAGAALVAGAMLGREIAEHDVQGLDVDELLEHAHGSLLDPEIGSMVHEPLTDREVEEWARA
jgi:hypothetical protein